jgi:hypothetical protein
MYGSEFSFVPQFHYMYYQVVHSVSKGRKHLNKKKAKNECDEQNVCSGIRSRISLLNRAVVTVTVTVTVTVCHPGNSEVVPQTANPVPLNPEVLSYVGQAHPW